MRCIARDARDGAKIFSAPAISLAISKPDRNAAAS
jgi:hypothetical protein